MASHREAGRASWRPRLKPLLFCLFLLLLLFASVIGWLPFWIRYVVYVVLAVDYAVVMRRQFVLGGRDSMRATPRLDPDYRRRSSNHLVPRLDPDYRRRRQ